MRAFFAVLAALLVTTAAAAQDLIKLPGADNRANSFADLADIRIAVEPAEAKPGQVVVVKLSVIPKPDAYTYPANPVVPQSAKSDIGLPKNPHLIFVEEVKDPELGRKEKPDPLDPSQTILYYPHPATVTWELKAVVAPNAPPGPKAVPLKGTQFQACNDAGCFPSDFANPPVATFTVKPGPAEKVPAAYEKIVSEAISTTVTPPAPKETPSTKLPAGPTRDKSAAESHGGIVQKPPVPADQYKSQLDALSAKIDRTPVVIQGGLAGLLLAAIFWGFVSLVTPCVFPMIPITVSLFMKQSNQSAGGTVKLALVYCLTIILVLGSSAVFLLSVFRELSVDPYMNIFLGLLFVFFALSLFGMYDIALPGFLLRFTERRRVAGGMIGTVFGALAFSIVSFTCVAPFLGGFAGMASSGQYSSGELVLAGVAFATAFAAPFFVLALFPSLLKKLPKSGGWLDSVKVVMGFLELAAAFKFFRTAELRLLDRPEYFTYDLSLGAWVAIAVAAGLYLLNVYRLPHDEEKSNVGVVRMLLGVTFLGLAVYLTPALFKFGSGQPQRPGGAVYAWIDAFLLPEPVEAGGEELPWSADLTGAVEQIAKAKQRGDVPAKPLIFVDFTGVTCTNCKLNEQNVFTRPEIRKLLQQYTLVQMYTDEVPVAFYTSPPEWTDRKWEAAHNLAFQREIFGTEQLPLYVILEPQTTGQVRVVATYDEGKINEVGAFVEFLKKPLEGN